MIMKQARVSLKTLTEMKTSIRLSQNESVRNMFEIHLLNVWHNDTFAGIEGC